MLHFMQFMLLNSKKMCKTTTNVILTRLHGCASSRGKMATSNLKWHLLHTDFEGFLRQVQPNLVLLLLFSPDHV